MMKILIAGLADETAILAFLQNNPQMCLVDFRRDRQTKRVAYLGEELPVYHSWDILNGLATWEEALYETNIPGLKAVYPPPGNAGFLDMSVMPELPWDSILMLIDTDRAQWDCKILWDRKIWIGEEAPAEYEHTTVEKLGAVLSEKGERSLIGRLFQRWKGMH